VKIAGKILLLMVFFLLTGCYKNHLHVQIENISTDFLASTHVGTPDHRQKNPPFGQRIILSWDFPRIVYKKDLKVVLTARFWNNTQEIREHRLTARKGRKIFFFSNKERSKQNKILTYRIQIIAKDGTIIETWKHQFWTEVIDVDNDDDVLKTTFPEKE
jgi:hypothetical protein